MNEDLSKLNLVELLDRLAPIPEPEAVSLWPQTAGWLGLGILLLAITLWLLHRWLRQRRASAYRRAALEEIAAAGDDAIALAEILRRVALVAYPRAAVAGLCGDAWLAFLDEKIGGTDFKRGPGRALANLPYAPSVEAAELKALAVHWIRRHRAAA